MVSCHKTSNHAKYQWATSDAVCQLHSSLTFQRKVEVFRPWKYHLPSNQRSSVNLLQNIKHLHFLKHRSNPRTPSDQFRSSESVTDDLTTNGVSIEPFRLFDRPKLSTFNAVKNLKQHELGAISFTYQCRYEPKEPGKSENRSKYSAHKHN